jgi:hypothetical protein
MKKIKSLSEERLIVEGKVNGKDAVNSKRWMDLKDFDGESWRPIRGFESRYFISNYGRVKRLMYIQRHIGGWDIPMPEMIMRTSNARNGYAKVTLCLDWKIKTPQVHRLVAEAFIPNNNKYPQINHKDEDKWNNRADNLEWCTAKYNMHYGKRLAKQVETFRENGKRSHSVLQFSRDGNFIKEHRSIREAAREMCPKAVNGGYASRNIKSCCKGITKTAYNYIWRYKNEKD